MERAVYQTGAFAVFSALLAILNLALRFFYHSPIEITTTVIMAVLGVVIGAIIGFAATRKQLQNLALKGETRPSLAAWLCIIGVLIIFLAGAFYAAATQSPFTLTMISIFTFPTVPSAFAARALLFFRWEKIHQRNIFAGYFGKLEVKPKFEQV